MPRRLKDAARAQQVALPVGPWNQWLFLSVRKIWPSLMDLIRFFTT